MLIGVGDNDDDEPSSSNEVTFQASVRTTSKERESEGLIFVPNNEAE